MLAAGTNVITTTSYNHLPTYGAETEAAFTEACRAGGSRFHAAGENPGFMFERLVATVTGLSKTIDRIDLYEATDVSAVDSRPMLVDLMGMGRPPEDVSIDSPIIKKLDMAYQQALNATADVLGVEIERMRDQCEDTAVIDHDVDLTLGGDAPAPWSARSSRGPGLARDRPPLPHREVLDVTGRTISAMDLLGGRRLRRSSGSWSRGSQECAWSSSVEDVPGARVAGLRSPDICWSG